MRNPYFSLLSTAWRYARREKRRFVLIYALFVVTTVVSAMNPLLYGWFVDDVQRQGTPMLDHVWLYVGGYLLLRLLEWAFHGPARVMERQLAFNLSRNFLDERYHQALHLPVRWHQDHHSGATINRLRKAYEALREFFENGFVYVHALSRFLFSFAAMLYFSPLFGAIGVLLGIFTVWVILQFDKPFIQTLEEVNEREHTVSSTLFDSLSNILTVITLRLEKRMEAGLMAQVTAIFPPFRRNVVLNEWKWFTAHMLVGLIYGVMAVGYVYQHWTPGQVFFVGGLVTMLGYVNQFTSVFHDIAWQYTRVVQYNTNVQTAQAIGEAYARQHRSEAPAPLPANWQTLELSGIHFSHHPDRKAHSLHNLRVCIRRGQRIAFIGESGSGKSTLLALLRGLYTPEPGLLLTVDGQPHPDPGVIADTVTLFPQDPEIFENTIAYNITLGLPFSEEEVMQVCRTAHFAEVVGQLPHGLESNIQEKGVNLSGGQKQRLALARGVLAARSSDIVLLDEPTSSVDPKTEGRIYDQLFREFSDKAIVSTLHRLHLLSRFDYVYVLQNGRIVDEGRFEELRQNSFVFQEMWRHQEERGEVVLQ
ncbi:MAG: ABC transporter ATP-binding protein [Ferruginibacter sp.]|nr:ABC transporter ATP-binding protein [Cytophagales bacterium]